MSVVAVHAHHAPQMSHRAICNRVNQSMDDWPDGELQVYQTWAAGELRHYVEDIVLRQPDHAKRLCAVRLTFLTSTQFHQLACSNLLVNDGVLVHASAHAGWADDLLTTLT